MSDAAPSNRRIGERSALPLVVVAAVVLLVGWFILSHSSQRLEEVTGNVEATMTRPQADGQSESERTAMIRLPDGRLIEARIVTQDAVQDGQRAKIVVIEDLLSGRRTYELIDVVAAK